MSRLKVTEESLARVAGFVADGEKPAAIAHEMGWSRSTAGVAVRLLRQRAVTASLVAHHTRRTQPYVGAPKAPAKEAAHEGNVLLAAALGAFDRDGHRLRVFGTADRPLFVALDVCAALEIANVSDACSRVEEGERERVTVNEPIIGSTESGTIPRTYVCITFTGLIDLALTSRKETARGYRQWVTSVVLPSIHKSGSYGVEAPSLGNTLRAMAGLADDHQRLAAAHADTRHLAESTKDDVASLGKDVRALARRRPPKQVSMLATPDRLAVLCQVLDIEVGEGAYAEVGPDMDAVGAKKHEVNGKLKRKIKCPRDEWDLENFAVACAILEVDHGYSMAKTRRALSANALPVSTVAP